MELGDEGSVCVTGGTGFIASWMIKLLLERGYSVHTTIRPDPENRRDISFLTTLAGANEKLKIFRADLSDPDSFDAGIEGCKGVIHVATPIDFQDKESEAAVTERAINGTLGILKACLKFKTVKKVVYTSSSAAVWYYSGRQDVDAEMMDESFWTDIDFLRETKPYGASYAISKTWTERAALEFAAQHGLDLVTIVPPLVVGPFVCPKLPGSVHCSLAPILLGSQNPDVSMDHHQNQQVLISYLVNASMVHVDDLSRAHIFLLEHPTAKGRYICSSHTITLENILQILSTKYPEFSVPKAECFADFKAAKLPGLSSRKLLDTGFKFKYGVEDMYDGAIKCCKEKGFF